MVTLGEDQQLFSMLTNPSSELNQLYMSDISLSSRGARELFTAITKNYKLVELNIANNAIADDACDVITTALQRNSCLVKLWMDSNPLSSEAIINIVQCLEVNNTLEFLELPNCSPTTQHNTRFLQEVVSKKRESQGCQVKLEISYVT